MSKRTNRPTKTTRQIWEEKSTFDFDKLLEPYKQGGTRENPVERSIGTIFDYLINKKRYPVDVAGAALLIIFNDLHKGKVFEGGNRWGSSGRQLVTAIRMKCDEILQYKLKQQVFESIAGARMEALQELVFESVHSQTPWFVRVWAPRSWRWLRRRKAKKANESA